MCAAPEAVREMAEKQTTQAKETCEKMIDATTQATDLISGALAIWFNAAATAWAAGFSSQIH
jgi:hypothetical protein